MALSLPLGPRLPSEPLSHPPGAPGEPNVAGCTICPASEKDRVRLEQAQKQGQDSLDPPEHFQGGLRSIEPAAGPPRWSTPSSHEDPAGGKHCEVFNKEANELDQDLEVERDVDGPGPGGVWGPWAPSGLPASAELEWDPAGDVGDLGPLGQKTAWTPGAPCELCGHRAPQGRGQGLENHTPLSPQDVPGSGLSHRKHFAGYGRCSLLRKPQDKKRQASSSLQDVALEVDAGAPDPASRWPLAFLLLLFFLLLLLVGATLLLPVPGIFCCSHARLARTPYLVLSYVNGLPPV
uniref:Spectrin repeat containing nuclear envelope family member 4 n=1 Tax=Microcebus murinus TaxID=30608 RepID=A0A8C5VWN3_MICMU